MKKNFLYSIVALCICLFTACSQEEIMDGTSQSGKMVSLVVGVPGGANTRALPSETNHKLRCIMQVVGKDNKAIEGEGMRQVVEVKAEKITFTFAAPEDGYKCLFWADFVTDVKTDNLYKTSDLTNITYNKTDNALFSTAADAFCGYLADKNTTITLKRPFAKVSVAPKNAASFATFNKLTVSYDAPSGFNMVTKTVGSTTQKVTYTNATFKAAEGAWFSSYIFAPANVDKLGSAITMQLAGDATNKTLTIEAGKVPLSENFQIEGTFDAAEGSDVSVDVSFDNGFVDPNAPKPMKIGDYIYADGKHGQSVENAIAVVFALASDIAENDDKVSFYGESYESKAIKAYAVALKNATKRNPLLVIDAPAPDRVATTTTYNGFTATNYLIGTEGIFNNYESPLFKDYKTWLEGNQIEQTNLSQWYIPSFKQLTTFGDMIFGEEANSTFADKINKLDFFIAPGGITPSISKGWYFLSSSFNKDLNLSVVEIGNSEKITAPIIYTYKTGGLSFTATSPLSAIIRPVLTIFE